MKNVFKIIIIIVVLAGAVLGIYKMYSDKNETPITDVYTEEERTYVQYKIVQGSLESVYDGVGDVEADYASEYTEYISEAYEESDEITINVENNQEVKKGDLLYKINDKEYLSDCNGRIVMIKNSKGNLTAELLNYDQISVKLSVPMDIYNKITNDTKVIITYDGTDYDGYVDVKGCEVMEDSFELYVKTDAAGFLPGMKAEVTLYLGATEESIYVASDAIENVDGASFMYQLSPEAKAEGKTAPTSDADLVKDIVNVGETVTVYEDGIYWDYVMLPEEYAGSVGDFIWR